MQPFFLRACDVAPVVLRDPIPEAASVAEGDGGGGGGECFLVLPIERARDGAGDGVGDDGREKPARGKRGEAGGREGGRREAVASPKSKDYMHHHRGRRRASEGAR